MPKQWLTIDGKGAQLVKRPTFEQWQHEVELWVMADSVSPIVIGDLLNLGEMLFPQEYPQAIDPITDLYAPQTLYNYKSVMSRVPKEVRQPGLKYKHYDAVQSLDPEQQKPLLEMAARENWTAAHLRRMVREVKGLPPNHVAFRVECQRVVEEVRDKKLVYVLEGAGLSEGELPDGAAIVTIRARKEGA